MAAVPAHRTTLGSEERVLPLAYEMHFYDFTLMHFTGAVLMNALKCVSANIH